MASSEAIARVAELAVKWQRLKKWGVASKEPHTRETQKDLDRFFSAAMKGDIDVTEISAVTSDVRRLEKYAEEYDAAQKVTTPFVREAVKTAFDIETADETLKAAKRVIDVADDAKAFTSAAVKEGFASAKEAAFVLPTWAWVVGGLAFGTFLLSQLATLSRAFKGRNG